uniref:Predicted oxidoreductase n=1 Tax=Candidatus Kentrum sp. MB TaxID=2138164 RepID=A0A450XG20_9GAMM|nr:MAG: Predicted oxidoreductase [Candidatus Kentron sp. MB]
MSAFILLRVSTPNRELAQAIAIRLVTERLAASVHVTGPIDTRYWWQGEIHHDMEWSCEARTHQSLKEQAVEAIVALHPFEVPEIFFHELRPATSEYEAWLKQYATGEKTTMMTKETPTLSLSPVIMGTWQVDRSYWTGVDDNGILRAVHAAFDVGVTTFDTAEEYGDGYSEQLLGKALGDRRQEAQILTKVSSDHLRHEQVVEACHRSLANLNTDYLDLYQIHWPGGSWGSKPTPIDETMEALLRLKEEGKIRAIGVSNFSLSQLQEVATYGEIFSLQPPYSLFWRHIDRDIRPYCEANGIRILAYSPLAQGLLTGKFKENHSFGMPSCFNHPRRREFKPLWQIFAPSPKGWGSLSDSWPFPGLSTSH